MSRTCGLVVAWLLAGGCGGGGGGGGPASPSRPDPANLSGRWTGIGVYTETLIGCSGEAALVLDLTQAGSDLTGTLQGTVTSAGANCATVVGQTMSGAVTGTVTGSTVGLTATGLGDFTGTVTANQIAGTFTGRFQDVLDVSGSWRVTR